jgi:hypothetical protein
MEEGVGGLWSHHVDAEGAQSLDRGQDYLDLFAPDRSALARMGIECRHGQAGTNQAEVAG